ncbi:MAG TPA: histidine phosphatase family protein [Caulobacteraceae bacterium]|jgi:phosphohistidine phosphatase|nr:histidine phosphatase family protein [Caulobacteraceae bacterium]
MQRLILLRHGKAESVAASGGDFERRLTERGRRDAALIGRVLADAGFAPDLALVSSARRARETWAEVAPTFPYARCESARLLYLASAGYLAQAVLEAAEPVNSLIIVGHNPGLHDFALSLWDQSLWGQAAGGSNPLAAGFPTSAAAVFSLGAGGGARFERMFTPRDHGGGPLEPDL